MEVVCTLAFCQRMHHSWDSVLPQLGSSRRLVQRVPGGGEWVYGRLGKASSEQ